MIVPKHYEAGEKYTPATVISLARLNFHEGNIFKYVCRWNKKNGIEDLKKALHYLEMIRDGYKGWNGNFPAGVGTEEELSLLETQGVLNAVTSYMKREGLQYWTGSDMIEFSPMENHLKILGDSFMMVDFLDVDHEKLYEVLVGVCFAGFLIKENRFYVEDYHPTLGDDDPITSVPRNNPAGGKIIYAHYQREAEKLSLVIKEMEEQKALGVI